MIDLKKLKGIIPQKEIRLKQDYSIKLNFTTTKGTSHQIFDSEKTLVINVNLLPSREQKNLKSIIATCIENDTAMFVVADKIPLLEKLYQYNDSGDNRILLFFQPILSRVDWETLRDSLYLRNEFKKHANIQDLKEDIRNRYGERGKTISNLCTAGYFEEVMIPLYNSSKTDFWEYWNLALDMGITALFVHAQMKIKTISDEIKRRIDLGKKYGLKHIHIHGIGTKNIKNIRKCIEQEKGNLNFTEKNIFVDKSLNVLVVELIL